MNSAGDPEDCSALARNFPRNKPEPGLRSQVARDRRADSPESLPPEKRRRFEWRRANPLGGLLNLRRFHGILSLAAMHFLYTLASTMAQSTWVLYTGYRYGWTPREVGLSLMA